MEVSMFFVYVAIGYIVYRIIENWLRKQWLDNFGDKYILITGCDFNTGWRIFYALHSDNVFSQYEFSCDVRDYHFDWMIFHTQYIDMVSPQCEFSYDLRVVQGNWRISHTRYTDMVSPQCEFSYGVRDFA